MCEGLQKRIGNEEVPQAETVDGDSLISSNKDKEVFNNENKYVNSDNSNDKKGLCVVRITARR